MVQKFNHLKFVSVFLSQELRHNIFLCVLVLLFTNFTMHQTLEDAGLNFNHVRLNSYTESNAVDVFAELTVHH